MKPLIFLLLLLSTVATASVLDQRIGDILCPGLSEQQDAKTTKLLTQIVDVLKQFVLVLNTSELLLIIRYLCHFLFALLVIAVGWTTYFIVYMIRHKII